MRKNFDTQNRKQYIPIPICEAHPEYTAFYNKAWELVEQHIKYIDGMPQNPYMDEAFCESQIWIWDTCFMAQFCKFAKEAFPGVESLKNFYEVLYDGRSLPKVYIGENEPSWTRTIPGSYNEIAVHLADNPPLFAWVEYENALMSGDLEHLRRLLYDKQYLQKHYEWIESLKEKTELRGVLMQTNLIAEELGYHWEGGCSGMDNTPRGRKGEKSEKQRPNDPNLLWLDAICQQALSANKISDLFALLGDSENEAFWKEKFLAKKEIVNRYYWDEKDQFYYDIDCGTLEFCKVMTVASYWTLTAGIASMEQAKALAARLNDPETLGGDVPLITLARNDGDYYPDGRYWRGGLWLPTAYAALKGLSSYGFRKETHEAASKILSHMYATYEEYEPHTIWECYAPEAHTPSGTANGRERVKPDFCGWSALGPISIYIEYVLGFHTINAFEKTVEWAMPSEFSGEVGIKNLRFGDVVTDVIADGDTCRVSSNEPYTIVINGKPFAVKKGENTFRL